MQDLQRHFLRLDGDGCVKVVLIARIVLRASLIAGHFPVLILGLLHKANELSFIVVGHHLGL